MQSHKEPLCEFCSCIEFETLSLPTVDELQVLNQGGTPKRRGLFIDANNSNTYFWSLGRQDRVEKSSGQCRLCRAICLFLEERADDLPANVSRANIGHLLCSAVVSWVGSLKPPKGTKWTIKYLRLRRLSLRWREIEDDEETTPGILSSRAERLREPMFEFHQCFQTCSPTRDTERATPDSLGDANLQNGSRLAFGGRPVPSIVNLDTPLRWLRRCLQSHGPMCQGSVVPWSEPLCIEPFHLYQWLFANIGLG